MGRCNFELSGNRVHLAVEGSCGGTSLALHVAADTIFAGRRVIWASHDMPDSTRFSQLFKHLSLVQSSRFHAMNFGGKFDRAIDALLEAANALPSVGLVVLDDWCESSGRIEQFRLDQLRRLAEGCPPTLSILVVSKGGIDVRGQHPNPITTRAAEGLREMNFELWQLWKTERQHQRILDKDGEKTTLTIEDSGFIV